jgi:hypothetical protein
MAILNHLKQHRAPVFASLVVGLLTINSISPFSFALAHEAATYAPQFVFAFVALGFLALRLRHKFVMLACFVSSIALCDFLHKSTHSDTFPAATSINKTVVKTQENLTSNELMRHAVYQKKSN